MLYLDQARNRIVFMTFSIITTIVLLAITVHGINAVGIFLAAAVINTVIYYALPDSYSKAFMDKYPNHFFEIASQNKRV